MFPIYDVDTTFDKFHDYCIRVLNKTENKGDKKSRLLCSVLYIMEMVGDEFKNIANHLNKSLAEKKLTNLVSFTEHIKKQLDIFHELFYKFNNEKAKELSELDKKASSENDGALHQCFTGKKN